MPSCGTLPRCSARGETAIAEEQSLAEKEVEVRTLGSSDLTVKHENLFLIFCFSIAITRNLGYFLPNFKKF